MRKDKEDDPGQLWHIYIASVMVQGIVGVSHNSIFDAVNFSGALQRRPRIIRCGMYAVKKIKIKLHIHVFSLIN